MKTTSLLAAFLLFSSPIGYALDTPVVQAPIARPISQAKLKVEAKKDRFSWLTWSNTFIVGSSLLVGFGLGYAIFAKSSDHVVSEGGDSNVAGIRTGDRRRSL